MLITLESPLLPQPLDLLLLLPEDLGLLRDLLLERAQLLAERRSRGPPYPLEHLQEEAALVLGLGARQGCQARAPLDFVLCQALRPEERAAHGGNDAAVDAESVMAVASDTVSMRENYIVTVPGANERRWAVSAD